MSMETSTATSMALVTATSMETALVSLSVVRNNLMSMVQNTATCTVESTALPQVTPTMSPTQARESHRPLMGSSRASLIHHEANGGTLPSKGLCLLFQPERDR